jgi:N-acetylglucosaminyldiphosphoundecaprenol N-acetyl-beta-D-mannosaminyltransferase
MLTNRTTFDLMGLEFDDLDEGQLIGHVLAAFAAGDGGWLVNPNLDCLRLCARQADVHRLVTSADLVVADGVPLVWAARLQGTPITDRVAGANLIWSLSGAARDAGAGVFLLGGTDDNAAAAAATRLADAWPGLRIAFHAPPFGFEHDRRAQRDITDALNAFGPAITFCGLGFPKQERLMRDLSCRFPRSWFIGSGASITFAAGRVERAPRWMQQRGLEWSYRLMVEPRRLWRRYLLHGLPFAARLFVSSFWRRVT